MVQAISKPPASPAAFVEPLQNVTPIRFAPREPIDTALLSDLPLVSTLCAPLYNEMEGVLGCDVCPLERGFKLPAKGIVTPVKRGSPQFSIQQTFRGSFSEPGLEEALLVTAGCEWRSISVVLVEQKAGMWSYVGRSDEIPLDSFEHCQGDGAPLRLTYEAIMVPSNGCTNPTLHAWLGASTAPGIVVQVVIAGNGSYYDRNGDLWKLSVTSVQVDRNTRTSPFLGTLEVDAVGPGDTSLHLTVAANAEVRIPMEICD